MMTSVVSSQTRGTRDRTLPTNTHTTQPQKQIQPTAEQIRLAQMIYDKNDPDFEAKVQQLIEVTGKTQDECMVALHDCNGDVNRAILFLLESPADTNSWETVGKKKSPGKEGAASETKEKKGDREPSRGTSNRRGRGVSRSREGRVEENGFDVAPGERLGGDRGRRGRGRARCFFMWETIISLFFFYMDLAQLLPKTGAAADSDLGAIVDGPSAEELGQSLVFTNSHHNGRTATHSYAHATANSYAHAASASTTYAHAALVRIALTVVLTCIWTLKGFMLWSEILSLECICADHCLNADFNFAVEMKPQPEPSAVLSQLAQRQQQHSLLATADSLGLAQPHAPQVPTPPGKTHSVSNESSSFIKEPKPSVQTIPSSAVEMPGSTDVSGLNFQFGALDFASDAAAAVDTTQPEMTREQPSVPQQSKVLHQTTLPLSPLSKPDSSVFVPVPVCSDHMSSLSSLQSSVSDVAFGSPSLGLSNATPSPSMGLPSGLVQPSSSANTAVSRGESTRTLPPHLGFSQNKDIPSSAAGPITVSVVPVSQSRTKINSHLFSLCFSVGKAPPNLAQGVPPLLANQYIMGPGGLLPAYPVTLFAKSDYYGVTTFPGATATMPGRESLASNPYSGEATKFGRNDSSSPAPATSLSSGGVQPQPQQQQQAASQNQGQNQAQNQQTQNQAFLNPPLPPGYGYTGLPYYAGMPGVPSAFQYGPTVFVPPASAKQPAMGLANPSNQYHTQHQASYGQHAYSTAFDDLSQAHGGEYSKGGYGGSAQAQANCKSTITLHASMFLLLDLTQGFHTGTPPPFSLPSALGGTGPLNPGGAPGYAPAPFLHILPPHQQPHSQLLHHHLAQDRQVWPFPSISKSDHCVQDKKPSFWSCPFFFHSDPILQYSSPLPKSKTFM
uniref:Ubiquitin associated protein 2b n=1 Tax=Neogobius melanostomus TaxID=47308 RepID=A0A8C6U2J7_9GOBI